MSTLTAFLLTSQTYKPQRIEIHAYTQSYTFPSILDIVLWCSFQLIAQNTIPNICENLLLKAITLGKTFSFYYYI